MTITSISWYRNPSFRQYFAAVCWNLGGFNLGIYLGWAAVANPMLQSQTNPVIGQRPLSDEDISYAASLPFIAGIAVSMIWGYIANTWGRKITGYLTSLCYIMSFALTMTATSVHMFIVSRIIGGLAYCSVLFNGNMYLAEIAEQDKLGRLNGSFVLMEYIGTLLVYVIGSLCSFQIINLFCLVVAIVSFVAIFIFPESPVYHLKNDREKEARVSLEWFRSSQDQQTIDNELQRLKDTFILDKHFKVRYVFTKHTLMALFIALYLQWGMQTTGINFVVMYTVDIFLHSSNVVDPYTCTVIMGIANFIAPCIYLVIANKYSRRNQIMVSYAAQSLVLGTLGAYYYCLDNHLIHPDHFNFIPVLCLSLYCLTFSSSAGPSSYTLYGEIFSSEVRNAVVPMIYIWNGLVTFLVLKLVPTVLLSTVHMAGIFWFFSISSLVSVIFTAGVVPDTKGKAFTKIVEELTSKACW